MKIGILGAGHIGKTLVRRLTARGHNVKVANSRGPETLPEEVLSSGAKAVVAREAVIDVDAVITSTPFASIGETGPLLSGLSAEIVIIDTSNYYPFRDNKVADIDDGLAESAWVASQLGRPIAKAWNSIVTTSFIANAKPVGALGRIALPVSADRQQDIEMAMVLVEETGFDAVYAGTLAESWRQQPGAPCYCTDLTRDQLMAALALTDKTRLAARRDLMVAAMAERFGANTNGELEPTIRLMRALFM